MDKFIYILRVIICYMAIFYLYVLIKKNLIKDARDNDVILIQDGRLNFKELVSKKCSISYIFNLLKKKNIKEIENVDCAILNREGEIVLYTKYANTSPLSLVIDGNIIEKNLRQIRKNRVWLNDILDDKEINIKDISYAFLLDNLVYIIKKET